MKSDAPPSFCSPTCASDHEEVKLSFDTLLRKYFKKVPCSSDFYFFSPPAEDADNDTFSVSDRYRDPLGGGGLVGWS